MPKRNFSEAAAKAILEARVPGVDARFQDQQSHGEPDFALYRGAERIGVMEVTMSTSRALRANIAAVDQEKHGGPIIPRPEVNHGWRIYPLAGAPIKAKAIQEIREKVGSYLAAIEAEGLERFSIQDVEDSIAVRGIFEALRIESGSRHRTPGDVGSVTLYHPMAPMTQTTPEHVLHAVRTEMEKEDNRGKLRNASDLAERHLFIVIDPYHYGPWKALNDCEPPETGPDLADEVTHLWVAAVTYNSAEWIVWYAARGSRWQRTSFHGRVEPNDE